MINLTRAVITVLAPLEGMYGESVIHDQAGRIVRGEPLYKPLTGPPYSVAAYTPLYYYIAAGLQAVFGVGFGPGRGVSLVAGTLISVLVYHLAERRTSDRLAGGFAALTFLGLGIPGLTPWIGLYKEDALGTLFSLSAAACLMYRVSPARCLLAGLLAGLAVLTKQTHMATMITVLVWLTLRNVRGAAMFGAVFGALVLGVAIAFERVTGAFFANTVFANANPFRMQALLENLQILGMYQSIPLIIAAIFVLKQRNVMPSQPGSLLIWLWLGSTLQLVGLAKVGSNHNYWLELAAITAVLSAEGIWAALRWSGQFARMRHERAYMPRLALLALVPLIVGSVGLARSRLGVPSAPGLAQVVELVRSEPTDVLAVPLDVLVLANRPILLEPYLYSILEREGQWDPRPLVQRIENGEIGLVVTDHSLDYIGPTYHGYPHWPDSIFNALRESMTLQGVYGERYVYRPVPEKRSF